MSGIHIPTKNEFLNGIKEFERHEQRDSMYKVALYYIKKFWGHPADMADGVGVLLLTWNWAFYRYGSLDFSKLEDCIRRNLDLLEEYNKRNIFSFSESDEINVRALFSDFLEATKSVPNSGKSRRTPVGVSKALHLLAPEFFPPWDNKIAAAYGCRFTTNNAADRYVDFMRKIKEIAEKVQKYVNPRNNRGLLKLIDKYNYAKYTKGWI